jgi:hypothetical protein
MGAPGLQMTIDGKPKVIDVVDASGSGDVSMATIRKAETASDGKKTIEGLSGRSLTLGDWTNPSGEWRVGMRTMYSLVPGGLKERIEAQRKNTFVVDAQTRCIAACKQTLADFDAKTPTPDTEALRLQRKELAAVVEQLEAAGAALEDAGPMIDCVVWNDGQSSARARCFLCPHGPAPPTRPPTQPLSAAAASPPRPSQAPSGVPWWGCARTGTSPPWSRSPTSGSKDAGARSRRRPSLTPAACT